MDNYLRDPKVGVVRTNQLVRMSILEFAANFPSKSVATIARSPQFDERERYS